MAPPRWECDEDILDTNCYNSSFGCDIKVNRRNCEDHLKECPYQLVKCRNKLCDKKIFRKDQKLHENALCYYRMIKCYRCHLSFCSSSFKHNCVEELHHKVKQQDQDIKEKRSQIKDLEREYKRLKTDYNSSDSSDTSSAASVVNLSSKSSTKSLNDEQCATGSTDKKDETLSHELVGEACDSKSSDAENVTTSDPLSQTSSSSEESKD